MGMPAVVAGDKIVGTCTLHQIPNVDGGPMKAPPLPFSAPLIMNTVATVLIGGKPAAVAGTQGTNTPPHVGLHPSDPYMAGPTQIGKILKGSATVLIGGKPAAATGASCGMCGDAPGQVVGSANTVLIG